MIKSIIKRDGRMVLYDESKIASAILRAMEAAQEGDAAIIFQVLQCAFLIFHVFQ